eukprot:3932420-Rhodomonas_salina.1
MFGSGTLNSVDSETVVCGADGKVDSKASLAGKEREAAGAAGALVPVSSFARINLRVRCRYSDSWGPTRRVDAIWQWEASVCCMHGPRDAVATAHAASHKMRRTPSRHAPPGTQANAASSGHAARLRQHAAETDSEMGQSKMGDKSPYQQSILGSHHEEEEDERASTEEEEGSGQETEDGDQEARRLMQVRVT